MIFMSMFISFVFGLNFIHSLLLVVLAPILLVAIPTLITIANIYILKCVRKIALRSIYKGGDED